MVRDFIDLKPQIALILYIYTGFMSVSLRCTYQYGDKHLQRRWGQRSEIGPTFPEDGYAHGQAPLNFLTLKPRHKRIEISHDYCCIAEGL